MEDLWRGLEAAARLLLSGDREVWGIVALSLRVSLSATLVSLVLGVPIGATLALTRFPGRSVIVGLIHTGMGLPPVSVGLIVSILLWRSGPFGDLRLLFTPTAMIIAQAAIATPIVAGLMEDALVCTYKNSPPQPEEPKGPAATTWTRPGARPKGRPIATSVAAARRALEGSPKAPTCT